MASIYSSSIVMWIEAFFQLHRIVEHPEIIDWMFQALRLVAILFFVLFTVLAIRQIDRKDCWRRYATGGFIAYVGVAVGLIIVVSPEVFWRLVMDDSVPAKDLFAIKYKLALWIWELLFWWSLILIVFGIGHFRSLSTIRKDTN